MLRFPELRGSRLSKRVEGAHPNHGFHLFRRVVPAPEEMETMIRVGGFGPFGKTRTAPFREAQHSYRAFEADSPLSSDGRGGRGEGNEVTRQRSVESVPSIPCSTAATATQGWLLPPPALDRLPAVPLQEPT